MVASKKETSLKVSVVCTVFNERESLPELLNSLEHQERPPDEVVIVDGGSTDGTLKLLQSYRGPLPLKLFELPGGNIALGRNAAIRAATGEVIASTDAGVWLDPMWLLELLRPFEQEETVSAVAGFFRPDPRSAFEVAMGATVLPTSEEITPETFLPSSRSVAYRKSLWESVGGYPEWLDYCEDLIFDLNVRRQGVSFAWAPQAVAYFRPRQDFRAFFRQYYRYARGDGKANLWLQRHLIRYGAYACGLLVLVLGYALPLLWALLVLGGAAYLNNPYRRLLPLSVGLDIRKRLLAFAYVPLIRLTGDVAKMAGYPAGVWWRWRHNPALKESREA